MEQDNRENKYFDLDSVRPEPVAAPKGKEKGGRMFISGVVVGLAAALLIISVMYLVTRVQRFVEIQTNPLAAQAEQLKFGKESAVTPILVNKLQNLEATIQKYFYLDEVTDEELSEGIYKGMLAALKDPYSEYYTAEELNDLMSQTQGVYYGIGAYVSLDEETSFAKISGVIEGAPAEAAQLRANDLIYEVDGVSTHGLTLNETVALIKGEEGTEVVLTIIRDGESDYLKIPVIRANGIATALLNAGSAIEETNRYTNTNRTPMYAYRSYFCNSKQRLVILYSINKNANVPITPV